MINNHLNFGRIAVLCGGVNSEREISIKTGQAVFTALKKVNLNVELFDVNADFVNNILKQQKGQRPFDLAFIALHGGDGEGGHIQALLDLINLPYTGSGMATSAICMDKILSKRLAYEAKLPVKPYCIASLEDDFLHENLARLGFPNSPIVIKPSADGSSYGVSKVTRASNISAAIHKATAMRGRVMAETWIDGEEVAVGFVDGKILPPVQMQSSHEFFDYEAKYTSGMTNYYCPTKLDDSVDDQLIKFTKEIIDVFSVEGWGRVDFIVDDDNQPWLLEVNTIPGMTSTSILPKAAKTIGIEFVDLLILILQHAKDRYENENFIK